MTTYFIEIDSRAEAENCMSVGSREDHENSVPFSVWHGLVRRYDIPYLRSEAQTALLAEAQEIAEEIWAEITEEWDGSNHVGRVNDESALEEAEARLEKLIASYENDEMVCWDAADWFGGIGRRDQIAEALGVSAETTDEELAAITEREERAAASSGECDELSGTKEYLLWLRRQLRIEALGKIDASTLATEAMQRGCTDFRAAAEAAIPLWANDVHIITRAEMVAEFIKTCNEIYSERAMNPAAI